MVEQAPVRISAGDVVLEGELEVPSTARGLVVFAHGSGSGRRSPRNQLVARKLRGRGLGTLLIDLLTADEEQVDDRTAALRFDVSLLAQRLTGAMEWVLDQPTTRHLRLGCFGASTGAAAALVAAAERPDIVGAVVSRGGRPDLAGDALDRVQASTLLIVGGDDHPSVLEANRAALGRMKHEVRMVIVPGATHLFEEPGALEEVARLAGLWLTKHLD